MIAVVGRLDDAGTVAIGRRVARGGAHPEVVSTVPPGSPGDRRLAELAAAGVGHAAALRSPAPSLDPADLELALRYLPELRVIVLAADAGSLAPVAADAAAWAGARLVVVTRASEPDVTAADAGGVAALADAGGTALADAIVLAAPPADPDESFAGIVAALAVRLDRGEPPESAWRAVARELGLEGGAPSRAVSRASGARPGRGPSPRR